MTKIVKILEEIISLLKVCGFGDRAEWFELRKNKVKNMIDVKSTIREIKSNLTGMGSFLDLSMIPKKGIKMTENQARKRQWELVEEFDKAAGNLPE